MPNAYVQRIHKNWDFLKENIEQHELRDHLIVEAIWDIPNFDKIDAGKTSEEKNEIFLNPILKSHPRAFEVFIEALKKKSSTHIIERLENTTISNDFSNPSGKHFYTYVFIKQVLYVITLPITLSQSFHNYKLFE